MEALDGEELRGDALRGQDAVSPCCPVSVPRVAGKSVQKYTLSPNPFQLNQLQWHYAKFSTRCCGTLWG